MTRLPLVVAGLLPAAFATAATPTIAIQPGAWTTRADIVDIQIPGAPAMLAKLFAKHPQVWNGCISAADAAKGVPIGTTARGECTVTRTVGAGGRFTAHRVCTEPDGISTTDVAGTYLGTSFTATGNTVVTGKRPMTMKINMTGQRTGGCRARRPTADPHISG